MRKAPENKISLKALTVWKMSGMIQSFIYLLIAAGLSVGIHFLEFSYWFIGAIAVLWIVIAILITFIIPTIRHRIWRYEVHEHEIELQHGVLVIKRVLIPLVRVQHVDTHQGPLLRKYQLASIQISTAATVHEIPALELEEADMLRDYISKLARVTDDDM
ncbi:PH domain-containing protein [Metabacillus fastidiosus]|uniref:PH domain-containing protein n=1 Tax=Metabacillus fastidiosus TaxID=1458 RepID=UPI002DBABEA2|nr:PH domain-containing protein [Metabacillus fastidiosus]MEC2077365.1 PH domain-containing protein [Metabacillus fastidiosus]